jgi:hypothetical protein
MPVEVLAGPYWRTQILELSEYPAGGVESRRRNSFPSSMRLKRTRGSPRPSGGRIQHQKGSFQRHAWSDGRYPKARNAIPIPSLPRDLRFLAHLMQYPKVVVAHWSCVGRRAAIWTSRRSTPASNMVVTKLCLSMCGCGLAIRTPVAVHPGVAAVEQDRPSGAAAGSPVDGATDRGWQRDEDDLGAFATHAQYPVAVLFAQVGDVRAGGLEDPQAEQAEQGHEREVAGVGGLAGCGEQGLELQMSEPEGRRFSGH